MQWLGNDEKTERIACKGRTLTAWADTIAVNLVLCILYSDLFGKKGDRSFRCTVGRCEAVISRDVNGFDTNDLPPLTACPTRPMMLDVLTIHPLWPLECGSWLRNCAQAYLHPKNTLRLLIFMTLSHVSSVISCTIPWCSVPPIPALLIMLL